MPPPKIHFETYSKHRPELYYSREELSLMIFYLLKQLGGRAVVDLDQLDDVDGSMLGIGIPDLDGREVHMILEDG